MAQITAVPAVSTSWIMALIGLGTLFLGLSVYQTVGVLRSVDRGTPRENCWRALLVLMVVFVAGYLRAMTVVATGSSSVSTLTASVFFLGGVFVYLVVVTSRKTIDELHDTTYSRDYLSGILEAMEESLMVVSRDGRITRVNGALVDLLGYTEDELLDSSCKKVFADGDLPFEGCPNPVQEAIDRGGIDGVEASFETKDGEEIPGLFSASLMYEDDDVAGVVCTGRDISRIKRYEEDLEHRNEKLNRFASVVSHDLRNPLNVAKGRLSLVDERCGCNDSGVYESLSKAEDALGRMEDIIDDVLTLTRGDGVSDDEMSDVSLTEVAENCYASVDSDSEERLCADLVVEDDLTLRAHPGRLQQMLENLYRNSVEHAGDDVTVYVGTLDGSEGFYVEDDGEGIPEEEREEVFESGYTTSDAGTGLGLDIVEDIAESHGWDIDVTEGSHGGARFEMETDGAVTTSTSASASTSVSRSN
ncbi:MAG: PAS domain S-box protein [Halobacteria archaeon]|nr:PAS domain S-box protein [Halobacteria archaeon]